MPSAISSTFVSMGTLRSDYSQGPQPHPENRRAAALIPREGSSMALADSGALRGKTAVITGAATGIGRASALLFARAGARVAIADLREAELARTQADVRAAGGEVVTIAADLARPDRCEAVGRTRLRPPRCPPQQRGRGNHGGGRHRGEHQPRSLGPR